MSDASADTVRCSPLTPLRYSTTSGLRLSDRRHYEVVRPERTWPTEYRRTARVSLRLRAQNEHIAAPRSTVPLTADDEDDIYKFYTKKKKKNMKGKEEQTPLLNYAVQINNSLPAHINARLHACGLQADLLDDDPNSLVLSFFFFFFFCLEITRRQIEEVRIDIISPYNM